MTIKPADESLGADERRELEDSLKQLRLVTNAIPSFVAYIDNNLRYRFMNKAYEDWFGSRYKPGSSMPVAEVIGPRVYKVALPYMRRALAGETLSYDNRLVNDSGKTMHVHVQYVPDIAAKGTVRGFVAIGNDVTESLQAEVALRESEELFRFMAESMPQKIFTVTPDEKISYYNLQWEEYTGIAMENLKASMRTRKSIVHPDDLKMAVREWNDNFQAGKPFEYEYRLRRKDGSYRWHFRRVKPMKDATGKITIWIGSDTDIDDMRRATEKRLELEVETARLTEQSAQLIALNQAKDEFISLASHQLRTPATGVKQYLGMLLQGFAGPLTSEQKMFLETAYESNERQITIVNDLLRVARIDAGKIKLQKRKTSLVKLLKGVVNEHASKFGDRHQQVLFQIKQPVTARIDVDRMRMVFDNIIDNAIKYTGEGKKITVSISEKAGQAVVAVADEGVGMLPRDIERIFQKFSRLEDPLAEGVEGSGLGLYWVQKIVDLHQGIVTVRSRSGKGTTFTVSLPL